MGKKDVKYTISLEDFFSRKMKRAEKSSNSFEKSIISVGKKMTGIFAGAAIVQGIARLGNEVVKTTAEFEGFENAIGFLSGGAQEGAKSMAFLEKNSNDLGISLQASIEGFQTLAGGFKGTGTKLEDIKDIFQRTSVAAAAMNLSGERTKLVLLALGQMASKGVVSMEELRRQLGDSLPGAAGIAARSMKMTTQDFNKLVESGKLLSKDFLPKFAKELEKTFAGGLAKSTKSVRANLNRLENSFLKLKVGVGRKFNPEIKGSIKFMNKLAKSAERFIRIPMSKTIEEERIKLNGLVFSLQDSSKSENERLAIIKEIQTISPEVAASITKEGDAYKISTKELKKFNDEQINRIILAKQQEKIAPLLEKRNAIAIKQRENEVIMSEKLAKRFEAISKSKGIHPTDAQDLLAVAKEDLSVFEKTMKLRLKVIELQAFKSKDRIKKMALGPGSVKETRKAKEFALELKDIDSDLNDLSKEKIKLEKQLFGLRGRESKKLALGGAKAILDPAAQDTVTTIKAAAPKTFNINIAGNLVGQFTLESKNITEGAVESGNIVAQELAKAIADIQAVSR